MGLVNPMFSALPDHVHSMFSAHPETKQGLASPMFSARPETKQGTCEPDVFCTSGDEAGDL